MGKFWLKVWLWIKVGVLVLVLSYALAFCFKNHGVGSEVNVWYSYDRVIKTDALMLSLTTFLGGIVFAILARTTIVTIRQFRELKERNRTEKLHRDVADMKLKAAMLTPKPPAIRRRKLDAGGNFYTIRVGDHQNRRATGRGIFG